MSLQAASLFPSGIEVLAFEKHVMLGCLRFFILGIINLCFPWPTFASAGSPDPAGQSSRRLQEAACRTPGPHQVSWLSRRGGWLLAPFLSLPLPWRHQRPKQNQTKPTEKIGDNRGQAVTMPELAAVPVRWRLAMGACGIVWPVELHELGKTYI